MEFTGYKTLKFTRSGRILTISFNRPEAMNAVNGDMHHDLARVFTEANDDEGSDIIVLTGEGRAFCAGGEASWLQGMIDDKQSFLKIGPEAKRIIFSLLDLEKPIICRLNGAAAGLGANIALMCDIIIAADTARIGDPHVKMGFVAGDGGAVIWPQLIGFAKAKEFLMTGEMLTAERAERVGLLNYVVPMAELDAKVYGMAEQLAAGATQAIRYTKTVTNIPLRELAQKLMDASGAYEMVTNFSADHQEALNAFVQKRAPKFTGR